MINEMGVTTRVHWLSLTVFGLSPDAFRSFWAEFFEDRLGSLTVVPGGARRGFHDMYQALAGAKVYSNPVQVSPRGSYFHVDLPGSACECLTPDDFRALAEYKVSVSNVPGSGEMRVSRLDIAADNCPFTPKMVYEHYKAELIKTRAKRSSINWRETLAAKKDDGTIGTSTMYVGSENSQRMLRIYDKRGFTRAELQLRDNWADAVFSILCIKAYSDWLPVVLGAIDKFFSVLSSWWADFITLKQVLDVVISSARHMSLNKMQRWIVGQVAPTLYVLRSILGDADYNDLIRRGVTLERLEKFQPVLQLSA